MNQRREESWLSSIVYLDMVESARPPGVPQAVSKARLHALIDAAMSVVRDTDRLVTETGSGIALCLLGDPEDALSAAAGVRERLRDQRPADTLRVRIGIHLGKVKVSKSPDGRFSAAGDSLGDARCVSGFAAPGQILASQPFYEMFTSLSPGSAQRFRRLGPKHDDHGREYSLYEFVMPGQNDDTTRIPETPQAVVAPSTEMIAYSTGWERAELTAAAMALEPYVGPRARVLVKDAAERASSVKHLYRLLVEFIPTARGREEFCRAQGIAREDTPAAGNPASTTPPVALDPVFLAAVEQLLAAYLGPLARVLVRQHIREQPSADQLLSRLAEELAVPQRREFLEAVRKVGGKL
jgi:hypothetical protein